MKHELTAAIGELAGLDQFFVRDFDHIQPAFQLRFPEAQKFVQNRKARRDVELLPDIALQQLGMIGHAIDDFRRRQAIIFKLPSQIAGCISQHADIVPKNRQKSVNARRRIKIA